MRKVLVRSGLFLGTVAVLLLGAELVLRSRGYGALPSVYFDPEIGTLLHPNQARHPRAAGGAQLPAAVINELGFRGPALDDTRGGAMRIACLGDSFTFGWGVPDEETYPALLQEALDALLGEGASQVLNCGMPGFNTWQEWRLYEKKVRVLEPDVVVIGWYLNDLDPLSYGATGALAAMDHPLAGTALLEYWARRIRPRRGRFRFEGLDQQHARSLKTFYDANRDLVEHDSGRPEARPYVERNLEHLGRLIAAVRDDGAAPVLLLFPSARQVYEARRLGASGAAATLERTLAVIARIQSDLCEFAAAERVPCIDLLEPWVGAAAWPYGEVDRSHPNMRGFEIVVDHLVPAMQTAGILD